MPYPGNRVCDIETQWPLRFDHSLSVHVSTVSQAGIPARFHEPLICALELAALVESILRPETDPTARHAGGKKARHELRSSSRRLGEITGRKNGYRSR